VKPQRKTAKKKNSHARSPKKGRNKTHEKNATALSRKKKGNEYKTGIEAAPSQEGTVTVGK